MAKGPLRLVVDDEVAHYWHLAARLLEVAAAPPRGRRAERQFVEQAGRVLVPGRSTMAAAKTPVGRVSFAQAVVVALELLDAPLPPHPYSFHVAEAVKRELEEAGGTGETLRARLLAFARARQSERGYAFRWER